MKKKQKKFLQDIELKIKLSFNNLKSCLLDPDTSDSEKEEYLNICKDDVIEIVKNAT